MDFDRYGIEEWAASRPKQVAHGFASAQADGETLSAWLRLACNWVIRRVKFAGHSPPKAEPKSRPAKV